MASFWDLPKGVREKIYRMHLVHQDAVKYRRFKSLCGCVQKDHSDKATRLDRIMPRIFQVSRKLEREAAPIFFGENIFVFLGPKDLARWFMRLWPRHARQMRSITLSEWAPCGDDSDRKYLADDFRRLASLSRLKILTIVVDEKEILKCLLKEFCSTFVWHTSLKAGPQMYLQMLRAGGMTGLRTLRNLQVLRFLRPEGKGSIPGGFLETVVRREIMQSSDAQASSEGSKGHFRFLDLPPELRNNVYHLLLVQRGAMYPRPGEPTSITSLHHSKRASTPIPHSALSILRANRLINREAFSLFYQHNDFVFASPMRLQHFIISLGHERLDCIQSMTFFYKKGALAEGGLTTMDVTLSTLRLLKNLRKLHILIPKSTQVDHPTFHLSVGEILRQPEANPATLPGAKTLFSFRNLTDVKVFPPVTVKECAKLSADNTAAIRRMEHAFEHFSYGLRLAQKGRVCHELYDNEEWFEKRKWPMLDMQKWACGSVQGCACRKSSSG